MLRIKLLILFLTSVTIISCSYSTLKSNQKYSMGYISGGFDGTFLRNTLFSYLNSMDIYDKNSPLEIKISVSHGTNIYITNIDNTSDRERVTSSISASLNNKDLDCVVFNEAISLNQFYIYAPNERFLSNQSALKKIKKENTETLVRKFIDKLTLNKKFKCDDEKQSNT